MKQRLHLTYFGTLLALLLGFTVLFPGSLMITLPLAVVASSLIASFRPSSYSLYVMLGLCVLGLLVSILEQTEFIWYGALAIWGAMSLVDLLFLFTRLKFQVERTLPGRFAQGLAGSIKIKLKNLSSTGYHVEVFDGLPQESKCTQMPFTGFVPGDRFIEIEYDATLKDRGMATFTRVFVECFGPFRLWTRIVRCGEPEKVRVYPNYEPVLQLALLSMESNPEQMGIVKKNRAGLSKEFHQLRDYHEGDMLSQIDWKASSKRQSLISRSYHEQRDQNLILAIDCGRRMRAVDGDITQFDHCLNAMLLLAYVALKQGDNVGIMSYGGVDRWLPPVKGVESMTTILNHLYDYQTSSSPSDYTEAVERIMVRQKRRSMIVFISNFRGEDASELIEPLRKVRQKHIVSLGNIREKEFQQAIEQDVYSFEDALRLASIQKYIQSREMIMNQLKNMNVPSVDVTADDLPVALANQYLALREMV